MFDISKKNFSLRTAVAQAEVKVAPATIARIHGQDLPKGDPLPVAKVAAIQAAKATSTIIPYCHPVPVTFVDVTFSLGNTVITVTVTVKAVYSTGVEMEALTGASVAALTLYDMLKAIDDTMEISAVHLVSKTGGKSQFAEFSGATVTAAVIVISDSVSTGVNADASGKLIEERLTQAGILVTDGGCVPDEPERIRASVIQCADQKHVDLIITTGGTGVSPRDNTPEAMSGLFEREIPGIAETLRAYGQQRSPFAMLSRGRAGIRGKTIIINLPGSERAVAEGLKALLPAVLHAFTHLRGEGSWHKQSPAKGNDNGLS